MHYGATLFPTDRSIGVVELARQLEDRGFDSVWFPEHTHIPTSRITPVPTGEAELPDHYKRCLDPLVGLAAAAAATERLRLGTGVLLAAQRDPIVTAKAVASLDVVSGGRVTIGIGFGWNEDEMNHHGVALRERREVAREHVLAMQNLWADDEASFAGRHVRFGTSWQWPKPVQRPGPPVLIGGGAGPTIFRHIAEYADGWIPIGGRGLTAGVDALRAAMADAGRDPTAAQVVPFGTLPEHGKLDHYEAVGATECVFQLPSAPRDDVLAVLDIQAKLISERR